MTMPIRKVIRMNSRKLQKPPGDERESRSKAESTEGNSSIDPKKAKEGLIGKYGSRKRSSSNRDKKIKNSKVAPLSDTRDPSEKSVHWYPKVAKKRHIQIKDMNDEERESVWYNENDKKMMVAMAKSTVKMMMNGDRFDDIDYCSRGLEGKTVVGAKQRSKNKHLVRRSVLRQQEIQRLAGINQPEELAKVSFKCSEYIAAEARKRAIKDEEEARAFLLDLRIHKDRISIRKINIV